MSSPTSPSSGSPITRLPYEILQEIFTHCLPRYPVYGRLIYSRRLPSAMNAPILLCHICSSWRRLALASPTLWTHLSCHFIVEYNDNRSSTSLTVAFTKGTIEFLQWWRRNQGPIPPFLNFDVDLRYRNEVPLELPGDSMSIFLEYLSSAQYLELEPFYWRLVRERFQAGYSVVFPNLHTLLISTQWVATRVFSEFRTFLQLSPHSLPALQRFSLSNYTPNDFSILPHWSTLTNLYLHIYISFDFWFSLIRAVPHLRSGYFYITISTPQSDINIDHILPPPQCTLLELTTLDVTIDGKIELAFVFPLSSFFTGLHLPSLRTLALSSPGANTWADVRAIRELYTVLDSTPGVTKLSLIDIVPFFDAYAPLIILPTITNIEPIWHHAKALAHLQFAFPVSKYRTFPECEEALDLFVRYIFSTNSGWLDLRNPASPICTVIVNDTRSPKFHHFSDLTMSSVRESASAVPKVAFDISWVSDSLGAIEVREEWGSRI